MNPAISDDINLEDDDNANKKTAQKPSDVSKGQFKEVRPSVGSIPDFNYLARTTESPVAPEPLFKKTTNIVFSEFSIFNVPDMLVIPIQ